jgi:hypothetical protein
MLITNKTLHCIIAKLDVQTALTSICYDNALKVTLQYRLQSFENNTDPKDFTVQGGTLESDKWKFVSYRFT